MPTRIDIELTSARDDGTWTWRAAGARQPKGVVEGTLLQADAKVGDVLRAEADVHVDGITVLSVLPPKAKRAEPERLEIVGPPRDQPAVTTTLVGRRPDRDDRRGRGPRDRDRDRAGRAGGERDQSRERDRERGPAPDRDRDRRPRREDGPGGAGRRSAGPHERRRPSERAGAEGHDRPAREPRRRPEGERGRRAPQPSGPSGSGETTPAARPRPKRLQPRRVHRDAVLADLSDEQRPVAEQVLKGGVAAVRNAVEDENTRRRAAGEPEIRSDALVALAEQLLPRLKAAEWRDRAEAAVADVDEIGLRDLRAVVTGAEGAARDDETRDLARRLREALERRSEELRQGWVDEVTRSLDEGRIVRALRLSARPPEPAARVPAELSTRLSDATGAAMAPDVAPDRWAALLEAVLPSPVRRTVQPAGLPPDPPESLVRAAHQAASRVPALVPLLGLERPPIPPPPRPRRPLPPPPAPPVAAAEGEQLASDSTQVP